MAKTKISEFSATPANNTDIDSINIAEGCAPSGINDAIRELMAQLKDFQTGAVGDSFNGPIGTSTAAAGAFTTLSASSTLAVTGVATLTAQPILSSLTASRAVFTDASKGLVSNAITGTGNVVMSTSPTLVTPVLGAATGTSFQGIIGNVTPAAGNFTTLGASSTATLNTLASSGATLTGGTINGMTVGATTASSGAFTTVTASTAIGTTSGGTGLTSFTSGGVVYASSSSALATGSAFTFDGTQAKLTANPPTLNFNSTVNNSARGLLFENSGTQFARMTANFNNGDFRFVSGETGQNGYFFSWYVDGTRTMDLTSTGLGIGTSSPSDKLHVVGTGTNAGSGYLVSRFMDSFNGKGVFLGYDTDEVAGTIYGVNFLTFQTYNGTSWGERMRLDSAGNLGLGVTPNAGTSGKVFQITDAGHFMASGSTVYIDANAYFDSGWKYITSAAASNYYQSSGAHIWQNAASGTAGNAISFTQAMVLDASGNLGIGTTSPVSQLEVKLTTNNTALTVTSGFEASLQLVNGGGSEVSVINAGGSNILSLRTANTERARIDSSGNLLVGTTGTTTAAKGAQLRADGTVIAVVDGGAPLILNRLTDDGELVSLQQGTVQEGSISVSGSTVSYNGGHLSRWAQTTTTKDDSIVKGTVLSNLDAMNLYTDSEGNPVDNEQLNKVKVSDTEGDVNVAGVFVNWTHDDAHNVDEINMAMTGDMIIRIAQGVTVVRGDLLMSAGDGTAKPQGDDIVRSKTVAKVTSNHITCTYADGSYCVPCVLMAC